MLTPEQIQARATSPREALLVSKEEWTWRAQASEKELKQLESLSSTSRCGLCCYYNCGKCPLNVRGLVATQGGCGSEFKEAYRLHCEWKEGEVKISKLRSAMWSMVARLDSELAKLPEEKKPEPKKEEPKLRHGDYKVTKGGSVQFFVRDDSHDPIRLCQEDYMFSGSVNNWAIISDEDVVDSGNFLDDLAALQEDVEKYENQNKAIGSFVKSCIESNPKLIFIETGEYGRSLSLDEALEFSLKLRQMVATAKRNCSKTKC